jgi:hypothetical protein
MKQAIKILATVLLVIGAEQLFGQLKYEKESRLGKNEAPRLALQFIDALELQGKVKWYLEEGLDRTSIEAKFTSQKSRYSIEFDVQGNLEDVEVLVKWNEIDASLKETIVDQFCEDCRKITVQRVQVQYTGELLALQDLVKTRESNGNYVQRYEIVIRCRTPKDTRQYEYLFSNTGEKLSRSEIVFKNASNLEY